MNNLISMPAVGVRYWIGVASKEVVASPYMERPCRVAALGWISQNMHTQARSTAVSRIKNSPHRLSIIFGMLGVIGFSLTLPATRLAKSP